MIEVTSRKRSARSWCDGLESQDVSARKFLKVVSMEKDFRSAVPDNLHPHEFLVKKLKKRGIMVKAQSFSDMSGFFVESQSPEDVEKYWNAEVITAVRENHLEALRKMHAEGRPLQCHNKFGESLLHLACRKQRIEVVDFLLNEVKVSAAVRDDFGRTPLHDACWTPVPNFKLVDCILKKCPDLLYVKDKRGHTPLFYGRQNHWESWIRHLEERIQLLAPKHQSLLVKEE